MNNSDHPIKSYSSEDIRKYLESRMSVEEMHALEKASLDDPFLADAIEGMESYLKEGTSPGFEANRIELEKRLAEKLVGMEKTKKTMVFPFWAKSAAAVVLLFGLAWLTNHFILGNRPEVQNIAKSDKETSAKDSNVSNQPVPIEKTKDSASTQAEEKKPSAAAPTKARKSVVQDDDLVTNRMKKSSEKQRLDAASGSGKAVSKNKEDSLDLTKGQPGLRISAKKEENISPKPEALTAAAPTSTPKTFNSFSGVVVDPNQIPVQGATITLSNPKKTTRTNSKGEFLLNLEPNFPQVSVHVDAKGFESLNLFVEEADFERKFIILKPDSSGLKEIVVSEYRSNQIKESKIDERNSMDLNAGLAEPVDGWKSFYEYLNKNKKINTPDSSTTGTEIISFLVDQSGKLSSFRIEQSISKSHDAEAIRLVKEGSGWSCLKGKKQRVTIYINF